MHRAINTAGLLEMELCLGGQNFGDCVAVLGNAFFTTNKKTKHNVVHTFARSGEVPSRIRPLSPDHFSMNSL